ncbi:hypothetical protein WA158_001485 [Blastocystis sp. Blastoise]
MNQYNNIKQQQKPEMNSVEEISTRIDKLYNYNDFLAKGKSDPLTYFQKVKQQFHLTCLEVNSLRVNKNIPQYQASITSIINKLSSKFYEIMNAISNESNIDKRKENNYLWKKLSGDFYRNISIFVPNEKVNAKKCYSEALQICPLDHAKAFYVSLILDFSCLLAEYFDQKQSASKLCLHLLLELQNNKSLILDKTASTYVSVIKRNVLLWRKQLKQHQV